MKERFVTGPLIAIAALLCCTAPVLVGALAATGLGAWLAAHGYTIAGTALIVLAGLLAWRLNTRVSRG